MAVYVGQEYTVTCQFESASGALTDPTTTTFTKQAPDGTNTTIAQSSLTHVSTGTWSYTTTETVPGTFTWEGKGDGTVTARDLVRVKVIPGIT